MDTVVGRVLWYKLLPALARSSFDSGVQLVQIGLSRAGGRKALMLVALLVFVTHLKWQSDQPHFSKGAKRQVCPENPRPSSLPFLEHCLD